jgi:hypothetical protein
VPINEDKKYRLIKPDQMNKKLLTIFLSSILCLHLSAQTAKDSATKVTIANYYKLALQYKDGNGVTMDYSKAYENFSKAADLGDAQSVYAVAYLRYKGLGCEQDYTKAAQLFGSGARLNRDNSMYFYGLCFRNGYGVDKSEDSAKYWLNKAAAKGYMQAVKELKMSAGENNNDSATALVQQINNAAIPNKTTLNKYSKIQQKLPSSEVITGSYAGWIIQYDWSGTHAVSSKKLQLNLVVNDNDLTGQWIEDIKDTVTIKAILASDSVLFNNTQYRRKDHYSPDTAILYNFSNARLNLIQTTDSVFLAGNVEMFSPERKEPSKPLFVALSRKAPVIRKLVVKTYPNPFSNVLYVDFNLLKSANIEVQLMTLNGTTVYRNPAGVLGAGWYSLPVQTANIAAGSYLLKLVYDNGSTVVKVVKI